MSEVRELIIIGGGPAAHRFVQSMLKRGLGQDTITVLSEEQWTPYDRVALEKLFVDAERDLTAWLGNDMQKAAAEVLWDVGRDVRALGDPELVERWRKLTTSDHLYYMCTKWFSDGDVHKYFSPFRTPHDAYIAFMNVLDDLGHADQQFRAAAHLNLTTLSGT